MVNLQNVSFTYQGASRENVKNICLDIQRGECVVLCGPSGCGKTTLTRLLNGLVPNFYQGKVQGTVTIENLQVSEIPFYQLSQKVGSVFQNPHSQFFNTDTDSEIAFGLENLAYPEDSLRKRVEQTVRELHIESLAGRSLFALSGGEKQKIAFASIYAMDPDIFVLDEPSSNLDAEAINDLKKIMLLLKKMGRTILIAEHRLYYLKELANKIVYLAEGEIKASYSVSDFTALSRRKCAEMGLRALDLSNVYPSDKNCKFADPVLEFRDVSLRYGHKEIVKSFDFKAARGECIGIIGHNGAGKSTFSRVLCGLHKDYGGTIFWKGQEFNNEKRLKQCYMVMQDVHYQLFAESVEKECCFGIKGVDFKQITQILTDLGLILYKDKHPNTLSGGQKQRLAVATSIISGRDILIFDEPTSGLDYDSMIRVAQLIKALRERGKIVFVVTHDYEFICETCTRILLFGGQMLKGDYLLNDHKNKKTLQRFFWR